MPGNPQVNDVLKQPLVVPGFLGDVLLQVFRQTGGNRIAGQRATAVERRLEQRHAGADHAVQVDEELGKPRRKPGVAPEPSGQTGIPCAGQVDLVAQVLAVSRHGRIQT